MSSMMTITPAEATAELRKPAKKLALPSLLDALREWDFLLREQGRHFDFCSDFCKLRVTDSAIELREISDRDRAVAAAMAVVAERGWSSIEIASSDQSMVRAMADAARGVGVAVRLTAEQECAMAGRPSHENKIEMS